MNKHTNLSCVYTLCTYGRSSSTTTECSEWDLLFGNSECSFSPNLSVSVWISYSPCLSVSHIQTLWKCAGRQQLGSVPLSCAITGGNLWGSRVHITTLPHIRQESLVCTHTKVLVIFIVCCCFFTSDVQCLPHLIPFHSVAWLCCALPSFPSASNSTSRWFHLPFCQRLPLTEAPGSDVW